MISILKVTGNRRGFMPVFFLFVSLHGFSQSPHPLLLFSKQLQSVGTVIHSIEDLGITVSWPKGMLDTGKIVNVPLRGTIDEVLGHILNLQGLTYHWVQNKDQIYIQRKAVKPPTKPSPDRSGRQQDIRIRLLSEDSQPLPGTTIDPNDSTKGYQIADANGMAIIKNSQFPTDITITHVGMSPLKLHLFTSGYYVYRLQSSANLLDEFTLGYGPVKRRLSTDSRSPVGKQQLDVVSNSTLQMALEGQVSGLLVTQYSGMTSASVYLNIRGQSSLYNGLSPLYVIDGVILASGDQSLSNFPVNTSASTLSPFSLIAQSDIQRIEVLKDADATSIYGSRGANGVILITTKHGMIGKPRFNLQYSNGVDQATKRVSLMNTRQYVALRSEAFSNDKIRMTPQNTPDLLSWDTTRSTDWGKWLIGGLGHTNNLQLSVSGGSLTNNYFLGLSGLHETNLFPTNPVHQRLNTYLNFNHRSTNKKIDIQTFGMFDWDDNNQFVFVDPTKLQFLAPNAPALKDPNGNLVFSSNNASFQNPWSFLRQPYQALSHNFLANGLVTYQLLPTLTFKGNLGWNELQAREYGQTPIDAQDPATSPTRTIYSARTRYMSFIAEPQLEFRKEFKELQLTTLAGFSWQKENNGMNSLIFSGFNSDNALTYSPQDTSSTSGSAAASYYYKALFGRINLNWSNTYLLNLTGRRDGSSRLDPHEQYGNFYAAGFAWIFSNEHFFDKIFPALSYGKLKASYGITGNDQIGAHTANTWAPVGVPSYQNIPGFSSVQVNPGRSWEMLKKTDLSMELGFAKDQVLFTLSWYRNRSSNQLVPTGDPDNSYQNIPAVLENKGWEFNLTAKLIANKNFGWSLSFNGTLPTNRLLSYSPPPQIPNQKNFLVGQSLNVVQAFRYLGVNKTTGIYQFQDLNHDGNITQEADRTIVGKLDVTAFGGIENTFRYKDFQVIFLFDARKKTGINYQAALYADLPPGTLQGGMSNNAITALTNRWQKPGDRSAFQQVTTDTTTLAGKAIANYISSSAMLTDASFIRLRKLSIAYHLPASFMAKTPLTAATVSLMAQNLFSITPYKGADGEIQNAEILPTLRTVELGIHIVF